MNTLTVASILVNVVLIIALVVRSQLTKQRECKLMDDQALEIEAYVAEAVIGYKTLVALEAIEQVMHLYNRVPASTFLEATRSLYKDIQTHGFLYEVDGDSEFFESNGIEIGLYPPIPLPSSTEDDPELSQSYDLTQIVDDYDYESLIPA